MHLSYNCGPALSIDLSDQQTVSKCVRTPLPWLSLDGDIGVSSPQWPHPRELDYPRFYLNPSWALQRGPLESVGLGDGFMAQIRIDWVQKVRHISIRAEHMLMPSIHFTALRALGNSSLFRSSRLQPEGGDIPFLTVPKQPLVN